MPLKGFKNNLKLKFGDLDAFTSLGAGKGNLEDANLKSWSKTALSIKQLFRKLS